MKIKCEVCDKVFTKGDTIKAHMTTVHDKDWLYMMKIGLITFTSKDTINMHCVSDHEEEEPDSSKKVLASSKKVPDSSKKVPKIFRSNKNLKKKDSPKKKGSPKKKLKWWEDD